MVAMSVSQLMTENGSEYKYIIISPAPLLSSTVVDTPNLIRDAARLVRSVTRPIQTTMHFPRLAGTIALALTTAARAIPTPGDAQAQPRQITSCETKWMNDYMDCIDVCPDGGLTDSDCLDEW